MANGENLKLKERLEQMKQRNAELAIATGRLKLQNDKLEPLVARFPLPVVVRHPDGRVTFGGDR